MIFFGEFSKFYKKSKKNWTHLFEILSIHKPSLGSCDVRTKFGPSRFSRCDIYLILKQTNRQAARYFIFL